MTGDGAVALVTGATSGIGAGVARRLADAGFRVMLSGRSPERGREVADSIGGGAGFFPADTRLPEDARALVRATVERFGRIDVLVNNAAIDHTNDLLDVTADEIRAVFDTNAIGAMHLLIIAAREMRAQRSGGAIINITSRLAHAGVPTMSVYSASKGALEAFTRAAAVELAPFGIRVNAVAPGMTRTPLYENWLAGLPDPEEEARRVTAAIPLGRIAEIADVAAAVEFLASPEAAYITGVALPVEGGYLAR